MTIGACRRGRLPDHTSVVKQHIVVIDKFRSRVVAVLTVSLTVALTAVRPFSTGRCRILVLEHPQPVGMCLGRGTQHHVWRFFTRGRERVAS